MVFKSLPNAAKAKTGAKGVAPTKGKKPFVPFWAQKKGATPVAAAKAPAKKTTFAGKE